MLKQALNKLFPKHCLLCQQKLSHSDWFCHACFLSLPNLNNACSVCANRLSHEGVCGFCLSHSLSFDQSIVPFVHQAPISHFIHAFKYKHQFYAAKPLIQALADEILSRDQALPELIIPIPLHPRRIFRRGYNQSALIAKLLAEKLDIAYSNQYLIRHKHTQPQISLGAKKRKTSVNNAFSLKTNINLAHIALVDDVITTTSTVNAAARVLKRHGVQKVSVWALARNS